MVIFFCGPTILNFFLVRVKYQQMDVLCWYTIIVVLVVIVVMVITGNMIIIL